MAYKILAKKELCPNQYELTIEAPYIVRNAKAGQFIIFRAEENGERVPLTIADVDTEDEITKVIEKLDVISEKYNVKFILSVSKNEADLPACAKAKVVISL